MLRSSLNQNLAKRCLSTANNNGATLIKKRHPIRNFILKTALGATVFYAGGVALSEYNEKFAEYFRTYVPLGDDLVHNYEVYRYGPDSKLGEGISVVGLREMIQEVVYRNPTKFHPEGGEIEIIQEVVPPTRLLTLELITVDDERMDPKFSSLVKDLNSTIETIINQNIYLTDSQIGYILECYSTLTAAVTEYNQQLQNNMNLIIKEKTTKAVNELNSEYEKKFTDKESELTGKFIQDFNNFKDQLEQKKANELNTELRANEQTLLAKHANEVALLSITQVEEFTKIIKEKVDKERDGRLGQLQELDASVTSLSKSVDKMNNALMKNEVITQMITLLSSMKQKLNEAGTTNEGLSLEKEIDRIKLLSSIVPLATSSCKCSSKCKSNCKCSKSCGRKKTLMSVGISELDNAASGKLILSNEQLYNRWNLLEGDFKAASLLPANPGILGHFTAKMFSLLLFTKRGVSVDGTDLDSVYAKVSENIRLSKLDKALADVVSLKGWPHVVCQGWIDDAKRKLEVEALIDVLDSEVRAL
ncbi:hypothetical protein Kpol_282p3 [Vanderwaltozyma polyspora DSM 70294]|uniref:MICOS complex subunit MIC60 n=1 Tax=Vanderwaltozyma polyspora (strain ATCC 22028 / DSM 70294 / BCRC 21397 / CBS 2163 / NBRC 10782 / NRRL Y-8283 / UCD 57-17) TaxID=436907 RepID=MIC60_VANPO|nr:uncharacterized protein Kpol_282p3 [Vanderwaltozyma polyspora DSM 70294]A7TSS9.1 RecName: Full=MICOS complex subunit MIC60; AltName: Full=Mitofilin; Flags: Precursor [Vanderwaltozyma polyspora DSM 70294]EDO14676.1 hypothetical protein Kpol_282p3 [Vanderwaltozyma polyspora DSM 70294]